MRNLIQLLCTSRGTERIRKKIEIKFTQNYVRSSHLFAKFVSFLEFFIPLFILFTSFITIRSLDRARTLDSDGDGRLLAQLQRCVTMTRKV